MFSVDILLNYLGLNNKAFVLKTGISERHYFNLKSSNWELEPSSSMLTRVAFSLNMPVNQLAILKTLDKLVDLGASRQNHHNFETLLRDFEPKLRDALIKRHKLFNSTVIQM